MIDTQGKYIYFLLLDKPENRKTDIWSVKENENEVELGQVKWFGGFRCYSYFPNHDTVYEKECLKEIALFCEVKTTQYKTSRGGI